MIGQYRSRFGPAAMRRRRTLPRRARPLAPPARPPREYRYPTSRPAHPVHFPGLDPARGMRHPGLTAPVMPYPSHPGAISPAGFWLQRRSPGAQRAVESIAATGHMAERYMPITAPPGLMPGTAYHGFGEATNGGYCHYPTAAAPAVPGVAGQFGDYGQTGEIIAGVIGAVATAGATIYGLNLQAKALKSAEHERERAAAAAAAAASEAAAQQQAAVIQQAAAQTAEAHATGGAAPTGGGVLDKLKGVPVLVWAGVGGGILLLTMMRRRR